MALSLASFKKIDALMPKSGDEKGPTSMAGALAWLRTKTDVDDETVNSFKKIDNVLNKTGLGNTVAESGFSGALDWLRQRQAAKAGGVDDESASVAGGKPFNSLKPKSDEEKRADEMASALDWLKSNDNADILDDDMSLGLGSLASFKAIDAAGKSGGDGKDALDWLRKQNAGQVNQHPSLQEQDDESTGVPSFGMRPRSAEEKRANEMSDALAWLRSNETATADDIDDAGSFRSMSQNFATLSSAGIVDGNELDNAMAWLRSKDVNSLQDDDEFTTLSGAKFVQKSKEQKKAAQMSKALDWLRSNGANFDGEEGPDFDAHGMGDQFKVLGAETSASEMENALAWLRGQRDGDEDDEKFAKLDSVLPKKAGQGAEERAKEMEDALAWLRTQGLDLDEDDTPIDSFDSIGAIPLGVRSQEERGADRLKALNWLRNKDEDMDGYSVSGFADLDNLIPKKEGQEIEDRANEMENALAWLRANGVALEENDDGIPSFDKVVTVSSAPKSQEERDAERSRALNWLRNKEGETNDEVFGKLEKFVGAAVPGQTELDRADQMANALNWLREKGVNVDELADPEDEFFVPFDGPSVNRRSGPGAGVRDEAAALSWLRNKDIVSDDSLFDPTGVFKKLDASLPMKDGQSLEDRAKDMLKALDWMRGKGLVTDDADLGIPDFEKTGFLSAGTRSAEDAAKGMQDALNWLRNKESMNDEDAGVFSKLDSMLPPRKGQSPEERAAQMSSALNWLRSKNVYPEGFDDADIGSGKVPSSSMNLRSPEVRGKDLESVMQWMRKGKGKGQKKEEKYDPTGEFRKLDAILPKKKSQTPEQRANEIESHLDWLRNGGADNLPEPASFDKINMATVGRRTPEEQAQDYSNALNWLRNKESGSDYLDPNGEFRKLDSLLPVKKNQSPEDRARELSTALDWLRNENVDVSDPTLSDSNNMGLLSVCKRSPEDRARDLSDTMNWLRHKKSDKYDTANGDFKKIDQVLPRRKGEEVDDRARSIESVMDWCRNNKIDPEDPAVALAFKKVGQAPFSRRTPEQRARDLADTMNWMRNKGKDDKTSDPTGDFRKLDAILPRKAGQSAEDRSRQIESSLDWIRSSEPKIDQESPVFTMDTVGTLPIAKRTPMQRVDDLDNVLNFLRNKGTKKEKKYDPTGEFKKLDKILPKKKRGTVEDRARDIEAAL